MRIILKNKLEGEEKQCEFGEKGTIFLKSNGSVLNGSVICIDVFIDVLMQDKHNTQTNLITNFVS